MKSFSIQCNTFQDNTANLFKNLLEDDIFVDVTLVSDDGKEFQAHKFVIASCSDMFRNILESTFNPNSLIFLHGIRSNLLQYIVEFIYNGKVKETDLKEFLEVAQGLNLKGLDFDEHIPSTIKASDKGNKKTLYEEIESIQVENADVTNWEETLDDSIYMTMKRDNTAMNDPKNGQHPQLRQKKEIKIARYQNSLKDFEMYKLNFNRRQLDETTRETLSESAYSNKLECEVCGFSTKFEEILKRHELRHELQNLQNSGLDISKDNFILPFSV